jgi:hypothetical protein
VGFTIALPSRITTSKSIFAQLGLGIVERPLEAFERHLASLAVLFLERRELVVEGFDAIVAEAGARRLGWVRSGLGRRRGWLRRGRGGPRRRGWPRR